jgi:outer membrane protein TolC
VVVEEGQALREAYDSRPELASNLALQRAAELDVLARRKQHLPNLTGSAAYEWSGSDYPLRDGWLVGGSLQFPLFSGGRTSAEVGEARADLERLRFDEAGLRQDILREVRRALLELQRAAESIDVTHRASEQARENLALAEGRYETGVGNIIELTDAQTQRARADADHVRALYGYQIAIAALERAVGRPVARP